MAGNTFTRRRIILLLALSSVMLVTLDLRGSGSVNGLRSVFGSVFRPVESVTRVVVRPVENAWHGITDYTVAQCPDGFVASGGGYIADLSQSPAVTVIENRPLDDGLGWTTYALNTSGGPITMRVYAMCVEGSAFAVGPTGP